MYYVCKHKMALKSISSYCPNCIEELVPDKKQLGEFVNWFVCPVCGFRERPKHETYQTFVEGQNFDRIKRRNENQNNHFK